MNLYKCWELIYEIFSFLKLIDEKEDPDFVQAHWRDFDTESLNFHQLTKVKSRHYF